MTRALTVFVVSLVTLVAAQSVSGVRVRHAEGLVHGFLVLRGAAGDRIADGDLIQTSRGAQVTSRLTFRFRDGSLQDETVVFSQRSTFQVVTYRLVQKGRTFPQPIDMSIDRAAGRVAVRYADDDGEPRHVEERMELPPGLANGLVPTLLKNVRAAELPLTLPMVVATPKPSLIKLHITSAGADRFSTGATSRQATHYVVKVEIGGFRGLIAPLLKKLPPDSHVWILGGEAPAFIRSEGPMFAEGPIWRIELTAPSQSKDLP
jgi:hypothetical protein